MLFPLLLPYVFVGLLVFLLLSFERYLYILDSNLLSYVICKCFLTFCGLSFYAVNSVFQRTEFLIFMKSSLAFFFFNFTVIYLNLNMNFHMCLLNIVLDNKG